MDIDATAIRRLNLCTSSNSPGSSVELVSAVLGTALLAIGNRNRYAQESARRISPNMLYGRPVHFRPSFIAPVAISDRLPQSVAHSEFYFGTISYAWYARSPDRHHGSKILLFYGQIGAPNDVDHLRSTASGRTWHVCFYLAVESPSQNGLAGPSGGPVVAPAGHLEFSAAGLNPPQRFASRQSAPERCSR